jgi:hypothetical protein
MPNGSKGHSPGVAPCFMNARNVEFEGLLMVLSVPPSEIFDIFLDTKFLPL